MDFIPQNINDYCEQHTQQENQVLKALNRHTHVNVLRPRMLSGHLQGQLLGMFSEMIKPVNVLEIGTYTGYSAICLAKGIQKGGKLITLDCNEELEGLANEYFEKSGLNRVIEMKIGNALDLIPQLDHQFDLVFIDADKENYLNYYHAVFPLVREGGYIIADNVLWSGKVTQGKEIADKETLSIIEFNDFVQQDDKVENLLLPFRDGLMVLKKRKQ